MSPTQTKVLKSPPIETATSSNPFQDLNLGLPDLIGSTQDVSTSKRIANLIKDHLPGGSLEYADIGVLETFERLLDNSVPSELAQHIYVGRSRFELVSPSEAELLRTERRLESQSYSEPSNSKVQFDDCIIFGGLSNVRLFNEVANGCGLRKGEAYFGNFANSESTVRIDTSVRGCRTFIMQTACAPVNEAKVELKLAIDALKRASADEINVILPCFPYARQDRKGGERTAISAKDFCRELEEKGVKRILTLDLHSHQTEGFFDGPLDNLDAGPLLVPNIINEYPSDKYYLVGADGGQLNRMQPILEAFQKLTPEGTKIGFSGFFKTRAGANTVGDVRFMGNPSDVEGSVVVIWDDMIDTGGTMRKDCEAIRAFNPSKLLVASSHGIFSFNGLEGFRNATYSNGSEARQRLVDHIFITDTLPFRRGKGDLVTVVSTKHLLTEALDRIALGGGESLRELQGYFGPSH